MSCLPDVCDPGRSLCTTGKLYNCVGNKWTESTDSEIISQCQINGCLSDNSGCAECLNGTHCVDGSIISCSNGKIDSKEACKSNACEDDSTCKSVCTNGDIICKESQLFSCGNEDWSKKSDCPAGCDTTTNNTCASQCENSDVICENGKIKTCQNNVYGDEVPCNNDMPCKDDKTCAECKDGDKVCENNQVKTCSNGVWSAFEACPNEASCKDATTCGECRNDATKCEDNESQAGTEFTCVNGQWENEKACKNSYGNDLSCAGNTCGECLNEKDTKCINDNWGVNTDVGYLFKCQNGAFHTLTEEEKNSITEDSGILCKNDIGLVSCAGSQRCGVCKNTDVAYCTSQRDLYGMYKCVNGGLEYTEVLCACCGPDNTCLTRQIDCM